MQKYPNLPLIVEVENLTQLQQVLPLDGVERVLCDNFSIADLAQADCALVWAILSTK
jgi:nicotinate-nucleotide pyrophosphorylase (carboxylating)